MENSRFTILAISRRRFLPDDLNHILRHWTIPARVLPAASTEEIQQGLSAPPDLILADPFAFPEPDHQAFFKGLRQAAGGIPLVTLLPADTRDYRDAAVAWGSNAIVVLDRMADELLPVIQNLISFVPLFAEANGKFRQAARQTAPAGESTFPQTRTGASLEARSKRAVERLSTAIDPEPPAGSSPSPSVLEPCSGERVFLRHLSAGGPLAASGGAWSGTAGVRTFRTACNHDCGFHYCGMKVTVRDGQMTKIEPGEFPDPRYRGLCQKGISYVQMVAHPERLLHPLKRSGERGAGRWERISWDQALDEIAGRIGSLNETLGPESMMFLTSKGQAGILNGYFGGYLRLASLLGASAVNPQELGMDTGVASGFEDALGTEAGFLANAFEDLINSGLVLIWGSNPVHSWMPWWSFFLEAQRGGTRLITIDPRFTPTAAKSDSWLSIRPGTDLYLALAMVNLIIQHGWVDIDYILRRTVGPFLVREDSGSFLRTSDLRGCKPGVGYLVWDSEKGGAQEPGEAGIPVLTGRYKVAGVPCRPAFDLLRQAVSAYTPEFAATKTGLSTAQIFGLAQAYATTKPARIFTAFGVERWGHAATFGRLMATLCALTGNLGEPGGGAGVSGFFEFPLHLGQFPFPDGKRFSPVNPARLPEYIVDGRPYPIRGVMVAFCNWVNQFADLNFMLGEVLPRLDLLVVADLFMTETARWADYLLPVASFFEREDMVKGPAPYLQHQPALLTPPGECRSDLEIAAGLAARSGLGEYFSDPPSTYLAREMAILDQRLGPEAFERLRKEGVLDRNLPREALIPHRHGRFETPTGRMEFYVERLLPHGRALPLYEPPAEADLETEAAGDYPLVCVSTHSQYRVNSTFGQADWLREIDPEPYAFLNPVTAGERCIRDGDWVKVHNARGYVVLKARLTQAVHPQAVYLNSGWHSAAYRSGHLQFLTHRRMDFTNALGASMIFSDVLVEVSKVAEEVS
jgi:anaerobic dimethyl sulfoxide reductase subunit A